MELSVDMKVVVKFQNCCMEVILLKVGKFFWNRLILVFDEPQEFDCNTSRFFPGEGLENHVPFNFFGKECEKGRI